MVPVVLEAMEVVMEEKILTMMTVSPYQTDIGHLMSLKASMIGGLRIEE